MKHFLDGRNLGLIIGRQGQVVGSMSWNLAFISKSITDFNMYYRGGGVLFPLYLESPKQFIIGQKPQERIPNLKSEIINKIANKLGLKFTNEKEKTVGTFAPIDVLDYIYAVLHSPNYRDKYKEFLKIDFPKVPYPKNVKSFWALVKLGGEIRQIHLLESPIVDKYITKYPKSGNNAVLKPNYVASESKIGTGSVYINETQFFANVPNIAWNFYIGGYQPAQKWLKDRKERILGFEDIQHYQKIIVALSETAKLMQEIDLIGTE
jgi:predicted helicase